MARQEIVLFKDDLDGSEKDVRTVKFSFDGVSYEIDLAPKNYMKLQRILTPYVEAGTKVSSRVESAGRSGIVGRQASLRAAQKAFNARVREWAATNGHGVKPRGRVPESVIEAYTKAGKK